MTERTAPLATVRRLIIGFAEALTGLLVAAAAFFLTAWLGHSLWDAGGRLLDALAA